MFIFGGTFGHIFFASFFLFHAFFFLAPLSQGLYERALQGREVVLGRDHLDTLMTASSLAKLLRSQEDYDAAEPLLRRVVQGRENWLGPDHVDTVAAQVCYFCGQL